jgi:hypothetical protein
VVELSAYPINVIASESFRYPLALRTADLSDKKGPFDPDRMALLVSEELRGYLKIRRVPEGKCIEMTNKTA